MKFIFLLIIYFAGFATAIYILAPPTDAQLCSGNTAAVASTVEPSRFVQTFSAGLHKCVGFGKEAAIQLGGKMKEKIEEKMNEKKADS